MRVQAAKRGAKARQEAKEQKELVKMSSEAAGSTDGSEGVEEGTQQQ